MIAHAYGITLSVDKIGCDVDIGQNVTIGTNRKYMKLGENTTGHKPKIGNLVRIYPNAVISGEISIGDCVLIASSSIVTEDVPSKSIVYGHNQIMPLKPHHINYLKNTLYHCIKRYVKVPGLMYKDQKTYVDTEYIRKRELLFKHLETNDFSGLIDELF